MRRSFPPSPDQLGFDALLLDADQSNIARQHARETAHLPAAMDEALPFFRQLLERHHAAMLTGEIESALRLREETHQLAVKLNGGAPGILASEDSPGKVLERLTAAPAGDIPLWGQAGEFIIAVGSMRVRIEMDGVFGIGATFCPWPGFSAHAVDWDRPFLSETGYRSFLGIHADVVPGLTPATFAAMVVGRYVEQGLRGKLKVIEERYRPEGAASYRPRTSCD